MEPKTEKSIVEFIKGLVDGRLSYHTIDAGNVDVITISREDIQQVLRSLRDDPAMNFKYLSYMTAIDYPEDDYRFHVVYELRNISDFRRVRIKTILREKDAWVPTVTGIFPSVNWHEREMMEMFGITVKDHPDPRKILLPDWLDENPLRKDFPHEGEELWAFHEKIIAMFNEDSDYQGDLTDPWLDRFNE